MDDSLWVALWNIVRRPFRSRIKLEKDLPSLDVAKYMELQKELPQDEESFMIGE